MFCPVFCPVLLPVGIITFPPDTFRGTRLTSSMAASCSLRVHFCPPTGHHVDLGHRCDPGGVFRARRSWACKIGDDLFSQGRVTSRACRGGRALRPIHLAVGTQASLRIPVGRNSDLRIPQVCSNIQQCEVYTTAVLIVGLLLLAYQLSTYSSPAVARRIQFCLEPLQTNDFCVHRAAVEL